MNVKGHVALVTGANRGLGRALTEALVAAGAAKVYAGVRNPEGVEIPGAEVVKIDVANSESITAAAAKLRDVDLVINNAGVYATISALADNAVDEARKTLETNFFGVWNLSRAFAPILAANGGGAIVNVLSVLAWLTIDGTAGYSASKSAAWALSNGLRKELKAQGTQVLAVHVGYMDTDMAAKVEAPKTSPHAVADQILEALRANKSELLADETSVQVKSGLSLEAAPYL